MWERFGGLLSTGKVKMQGSKSLRVSRSGKIGLYKGKIWRQSTEIEIQQLSL